ncbi:MAG TPA: type II toxin-antitoxin system VapB family antitoxin [Dongiaceae bacterium]
MALSIKDPEADRLARELAKATGESLTEAVTNALRERLRVIQGGGKPRQARIEELMEITRRFSQRPVYDDRTADEIIGYDEHGLPR